MVGLRLTSLKTKQNWQTRRVLIPPGARLASRHAPPALGGAALVLARCGPAAAAASHGLHGESPGAGLLGHKWEVFLICNLGLFLGHRFNRFLEMVPLSAGFEWKPKGNLTLKPPISLFCTNIHIIL